MRLPKLTMENVLNNCLKNENGCLVWGGKTLKGFPTYSRVSSLRRWVWEQHHPNIGNWRTSRVYNRCHERLCLNHRHMYVGVASQSYTQPEYPPRTGEENSHHVLTEEDIMTIRDLRREGNSARYISSKFKISVPHCHRIIRRESWSHI
jgi:hypothetical protein